VPAQHAMDQGGWESKKGRPSGRLTVKTAAVARRDHRGSAHPMAKCLPIKISGYGTTPRYPRMETFVFITVGGPRMQAIWEHGVLRDFGCSWGRAIGSHDMVIDESMRLDTTRQYPHPPPKATTSNLNMPKREFSFDPLWSL